MSTDLTPKQRKAVRVMRQAMDLLPEPEQTLIRTALKELWQAVLAPMYEQHNAKVSAMSLAIQERLGHEPQDDELITPSDQHRAQEILEMYPRADT